ncbi:hypothetical protein A3K55_01220 [Candidatus Shapirobacteria bacterium RBG_13_44_7]|uniref:SAM-dependent methyltransferase n=1 Tax=Candidatus Shapirobacteria bacterium RBG_13_44_7 TaxID=1802149 RepID=A0A1F7SH89_9BACT|nr:MAG: hypothetical protein A3K55_01220 [Candidatus Shapirobacteria bacterium RBG_13_44_7]
MKRIIRSPDEGSYRDPDGFVFLRGGEVFRQVNMSYKDDYDWLMSSGLYSKLTKEEWLVAHKEVEKGKGEGGYKIIKPEQIPFISYPYEWCFSQLKEAALLTLKIELICLEHGMSLKDASAYNIQFVGTKPILIDSLSFEKYKENQPWVAYRQFCQHFLAPLALMATKDIRLGELMKIYIDGLPLDLTERLLPVAAFLDLGILGHIKLNARAQGTQIKKPERELKLSKRSLLSLIRHLYSTVEKLRLKRVKTEWGNYYQETNYSKKAFGDKQRLVKKYLLKTRAKKVIDLGANSGVFSKIAADIGAETVSVDIDPLAVEKNYKNFRKGKDKILPLVVDLTNPSPALGWENLERKAFLDRAGVETVMALALIHHLVIGHNLSFEMIAKSLARMGKYLIVEFIPKEDSKVQILLQNREDIFDNYSEKFFEDIFKKFFKILDSQKIKDSKRIIYLMERR